MLCTCLILGEIHALSRPQQAGYAASNSLTWPVLDVSWPVWPCLGVSLGPTCGHPEWNYGHQGLHFESRSAKRHRKTWIGLHTLLVAILSQITGIKGLILKMYLKPKMPPWWLQSRLRWSGVASHTLGGWLVTCWGGVTSDPLGGDSVLFWLIMGQTCGHP